MWRTALSAALLACAALGQDQGVRQGDHFRVVPHFPDGGALAEAALAAAEAAWPLACAAYGLAPPDPGRHRMVVHLYRSREAFDEGCLRCEERTWPAHSGLTSGRWGIALVHIGRGLDDAAMDALGLTDPDEELIAHEAAHLIGHHHVLGYEDHPAWLTEGLAEAVATRVAGGTPSVQSRMAWLGDLQARGRLPGVARVVAGDLEPLDEFRRYSLYAALFDHIDREEPRLLGRLRRGRVLEPSQALRLDAALRDQLAASRPRWAVGEGAFEQDGDRWRLVARAGQDLDVWSLSGDTTPPVVEGRLELGRGALEVRVGRELLHHGESWAERFVVARFDRQGVALLLREEHGGAEARGAEETALATWTGLLPDGARTRVAVDGSGTRVEVAGEVVVHTDEGADGTSWGLGATPGSWGWIADLRVGGSPVQR